MRAVSSRLVLSILAVALAACTGDHSTRNPSPAAASQARAKASLVSAPFDVSAIVDQIHFAFRPGGQGAHEAGHSTHAVKVTRAGAVILTPYHHPTADDAPGRRRARAVIQGAPVRLETRSIRRGDWSLSGPARGAEIRRDGSLALSRGEAVELLRNSAAGVEQSWSFSGRPPGDGDLVVRVAAAGQKYVGVTSGGLHFTDPRSGLGFRYGHATWVSKDGKRTRVGGRFERGQLVLSVPASVVDSSSYPAVLDPTISAEFGMDQPVQGPAWNDQGLPVLASDGTSFLMVWEDSRSGTNKDIYCARVSAAGVLLDTTGVPVTQSSGYQERPSVTYNGTNFLAVWEDSRSGTYDIYGARISKAGVVMDTTNINISSSTTYKYAPAVSSDGTDFLVVWTDDTTGDFDIYGARVSGAGVVLDATGFNIFVGAGEQGEPNVAHDGTGYLAVWADYAKTGDADVAGARISSAGAVVGSAITISSAAGDQRSPKVDSAGGGFFVAWSDKRGGTSFDVYGARVSGAGVVQDALGVEISKGTGARERPEVASDGTGYLVVWQDKRGGTDLDIYAARVNASGVVQDSSGISIAAAVDSQLRPSVAFDGTNYMVAWGDRRSGSSFDVYAKRVSKTGALVDTTAITVSTANNGQVNPAVAHDGTNYLIVWTDSRSDGSNDLFGTRVDGTGKVLDTTGIQISKVTQDQQRPAVAFGGGTFMVVWEDFRNKVDSDIYAARVSTAGVLMDTGGKVVSAAAKDQTRPRVSFGGTTFLVTWQDERNSATDSDIYGARISSAAVVADAAGIAVTKAADDQVRPAAAYDGTNFLVVWQDGRSGTRDDIYGARVSGAGVVLDTAGVALDSAVALDKSQPAVTHDGTSFLVAWRSTSTGGGTDIVGVRVDGTGKVLDTTTIAIAKGSADDGALKLGSNNTNSLVVWQQVPGTGGDYDLYGARVSSAGKVIETKPFLISSGVYSKQDQNGVGLVHAGKETYALSYSRFDTNPTFKTPRIQARLVTWQAQGSACALAADCDSGHCVDGFCCDTACGGGVASDCMTCSKTAGAAADGTCGPVSSGTSCRAAAGICDAAETCDGTSTACPTDTFLASTTECRKTAGVCDVAEKCSGTAAACPADTFLASTSECRKAAGVCDAAEKCSGAAATCPADVFQPDNTPCAGGACLGGACVPKPDAAVIADQGAPDAGVDSSVADTGGTKPDTGAVLPDKGLSPDTSKLTPSSGGGCVVGASGHAAADGFLAVLPLLGILWWRRRR